MKQPSVIAYGDASSLDAKTQFVASYAPRETVGRANVACDAGSIYKVRVSIYHYIFPEREGGCELCEQTKGLRYINCDAFASPFRLTSFGTFPYGAG